METRRYYNRYQRPMPINTGVHYMTVEDDSHKECLEVTSLAMVYAPMQCFSDLYDSRAALKHGTIFKDLNKPFSGKRC